MSVIRVSCSGLFKEEQALSIRMFEEFYEDSVLLSRHASLLLRLFLSCPVPVCRSVTVSPVPSVLIQPPRSHAAFFSPCVFMGRG